MNWNKVKWGVLILIVVIIAMAFFNQVEHPLLHHNNLRKLARLADQKAGMFNEKFESPERRDEWINKMLMDPSTGKIPENIRAREVKFKSNALDRRSIMATESHSWTSRGPFNIGGRTRALAVDVRNDDVIIAGGVSGGMWKSIDGGSSWIKTSAASDLHSVTAVAQDTRSGHEDTWYYVTGELIGNSASSSGATYLGNGVFKSTDGGDSWTNLEGTASNTPEELENYFDVNYNVVVNPINGDIHVASFGVIISSTDGGTSWTTTLNANGYFADVAVTSTGVLYATISSDGDGGIYRSTDGSTWTSITPSGFPSSYNRLAIAPSADGSIIYLVGEASGSGRNDHILYKYKYHEGLGNGNGTASNGGVWLDRSAQLPAYGGNLGNYSSQGSYDVCIAVHPSDTNTVFIGGRNIFRSTDGFTSEGNTQWVGGYATNNDVSIYPNSHPDVHRLVFLNDSPNALLSGTDGGIAITSNCLNNESDGTPVNWTSLNSGYLTTQVHAFSIDETGTTSTLIAGFQDNGTFSTSSTSSTAAWLEDLSGDGAFSALTSDGNVKYVSSQNGNIYRFQYANGNLVQWTRLTPSRLINPQFISPFVIDPNDEDIMYMPDDSRILRNDNLSGVEPFNNAKTTQHWDSLSNTLTNDNISILAISTSPANILYYGTEGGEVYKMTAAHSSNPSVSDITSSSFPNGYVSSIAVNPADANEIYVVFSNYSVQSIWRSTDGGSSWTHVSGNLEENANGSGDGPSIRWMDMVDQGNNMLYMVGTSTGVYSTTSFNGNATVWSDEALNEIGNVVVPMLKLREDGLVAVGTHGFGLFTGAFDVEADTSSSITAESFPWTSDFSDQSDWTASGGWVIGTDVPAGSYSDGMGAIASTTADNGFAMYDSDDINGTAGSLTMTNPIDLSDATNTGLILEFYGRNFYDSLWVEYSIDGAIWDDIGNMYYGIDVNQSSENPSTLRYNLNVLDGESTVWLRFRYEAGNGAGYASMIDDIIIEELHDNDIELVESMLDHTTALYGYYGMTPVSLVQDQLIRAVVKNVGSQTQTGVQLNTSVSRNGVTVYEGNSAIQNLAPGVTDTLFSATYFKPVDTGSYYLNVDFEQSETDATIDNNGEDSIVFQVTDSMFSRAYWLSRTYSASSLGANAEFACNYFINAPVEINSANVIIHAATAEGCEIRMKLYSLNDNTFERTLLLTSDTALTPESAESGSVAFRFPFNKDGVNEFLEEGSYTLALEVISIPDGGEFYMYGDNKSPGVYSSSSSVKSEGTWYTFNTMLSHVSMNINTEDVVVTNPTGDKAALLDTLIIEEGEECTSYDFAYENDSLILWTDHLWNFGDGNLSNSENPTYTYTEEGTYQVCLQASNADTSDELCMDILVDCFDTTIVATTDLNKLAFDAYPNPAHQILSVDIEQEGVLNIYNVNGAIVYQENILPGVYKINISQFENGIYLIDYSTRDH